MRAMDTDKYFPAPYSVSPLPAELKNGLYGPGMLGLVSVISTLTLSSFMFYRMINWQKYYPQPVGHNQYLVLILNLLIADCIQGISFLVSFHWIRLDAILAPTPACFSQGFFLNLGDTSSGMFVFFVACLTFYNTVKLQRLGYKTFVSLILLAWFVAMLLTALGPIMHRHDFYSKAGGWCWISSKYETDRIAYHYGWVFFFQFATCALYLYILVHLKRAVREVRASGVQSQASAQINRTAKMMVLFPVAYLLITLPLSIGRMWIIAHNGDPLPDSYACVAGSLLASCGFIDSLLYTWTRRTLLSSDGTLGSQNGSSRFRKAHGQASGINAPTSSNGAVGMGTREEDMELGDFLTDTPRLERHDILYKGPIEVSAEEASADDKDPGV